MSTGLQETYRPAQADSRRSPGGLRRAHRRALGVLLLAVATLGAVQQTRAAPYGPFNRPGDTWQVARTRHFRFYFTPDTPHTTGYLMSIADATFERLNRFYQVEMPGPITVTVVGDTAYANGFADSIRNRITIMATPANHHSRRRTPWLENVFTHELSHILSLNRATHVNRRIPIMLGTGVFRSSDTQTLVRLPISGRNYPHWFVEGVAQFDTQRLARDAYDENRRAFQRAAFEDGRLLPFARLAFFGGESWYNTGFDFLNYLEERFGKGTVHRVFAAYGDRYYPIFDSVFEDVLGIPLPELEAAYRTQVAARYQDHLKASSYGHHDGQPVRFEEVEQPYRSLSPGARDDLRGSYQGTPLRFVRGRLFYRSAGALSHGRLSASGELTEIESISDGFAVAPHGNEGYFVLRQLDSSPELSFYRPEFESPSLVTIDAEGNERVLLRESRFHDFDVCAKRSELAASYNDGDGGLQLVLYDLEDPDGPQVKVDQTSRRFPLGQVPLDEVRSPRYGPNCERLYFSRRVGDDHDVYALVLATGALETVSAESAFELYPAPGDDGVYFTSARRGTPDVYFRPYGGGPAVPITQALTDHHYPVPTPAGLVFARRYSTGFQMHMSSLSERPAATPDNTIPQPTINGKTPDPSSPDVATLLRGQTPVDYAPLSLRDLHAPTFVPIVDLIYDTGFAAGSPLRLQAGMELYIEDQLRQHSLLLRGFAGNQSSLLFDYENRMSALTLRARGGVTDIRSLYLFDSGSNRFEHVTDYQWAFLYGAVHLPLNLFYRVGVSAETTLDVGSTLGARSRPYDWLSPRFARNLYGMFLEYTSLDRSDPLFRERDINRRGYSEASVRMYFGDEYAHPLLADSDQTLQVGHTPHLRAELRDTTYIALPALADGYYDHTLQVDVQLGYISEDVRFLPFIGGGRLFSLSSPAINNSVGFGGYRFFSVRGESLANVALTYRAPLLRRVGLDLGPLYLEDIYWQVFTSWGNIWGYDRSGERQIPFVDPAPNGQRVLGDVGLDIRLGHYFQQNEANVGTTLRAVYRIIPFSRCPDETDEPDPTCPGPDGERGFIFYFLVGGGF